MFSPLVKALKSIFNLDSYSKALGVIDQEHLKIHAGEGFTVAARAIIANGGGCQILPC